MSRKANEEKKSIQLTSELRNVPLRKIRIPPHAQRELRPAWMVELYSKFDPELMGYPTLSFRDGWYWAIDGQHRIEACKAFLGDGWETQSITCRVYNNLSESDEARLFVQLNHHKTVSSYENFRVAVNAGFAEENTVKRTVEKAGLNIAKDKGENNISAVGTLLKVYRRSDTSTLLRTLQIVHKSFGAPGMLNTVIDGTALMCERYNGVLDDGATIERLQQTRGGIGALMSRANTLRKQTGEAMNQCIAAALVDTINGGRGGKKLPSWWRE
jgi:uncharacterized protein DUF6551